MMVFQRRVLLVKKPKQQKHIISLSSDDIRRLNQLVFKKKVETRCIASLLLRSATAFRCY